MSHFPRSRSVTPSQSKHRPCPHPRTKDQELRVPNLCWPSLLLNQMKPQVATIKQANRKLITSTQPVQALDHMQGGVPAFFKRKSKESKDTPYRNYIELPCCVVVVLVLEVWSDLHCPFCRISQILDIAAILGIDIGWWQYPMFR